MRYQRLRHFTKTGIPFASEALVMCFFMQRTHKEIASAAMRALDLFRERIRPHQFDCYIGHDGYTLTLTDSLWNELREQMLGPDEVMLPRFASGQGQVTDFYMEYRGLRIPSASPHRENDASFLFFRLPTEYLEEQGPEGIRALALEIAQALPFNSGYVDLALCQKGHAVRAVDLVRTRYKGLHIVEDTPEIDLGTQIDGVHWLNFLGQPVLGQLGGVAGLRERLTHPGICLHEMPGEQVLIALGEAPSTGDVEAGETLPLHRELARLLEPWLYHHKVPFGDMTPEEQLRWERRFLEE